MRNRHGAYRDTLCRRTPDEAQCPRTLAVRTMTLLVPGGVLRPLTVTVPAVTVSVPGGARCSPAGRAGGVPGAPVPKAPAFPRTFPAHPGAAGIRPRVPRESSRGVLRRGRPRTRRNSPDGGAGTIPLPNPDHRADHVPGRVEDVRRSPAGPLFPFSFPFSRDFARPNVPGSTDPPPTAFPRPLAPVVPRGFTRAVADARKAVVNPAGRAGDAFSGGPDFRPSSPGSRPPGCFPARMSPLVPREPENPTGRYGGRLRADGHSRAGLLRTRTPATRLRPRRR
jgi:hypothetical protein